MIKTISFINKTQKLIYIHFNCTSIQINIIIFKWIKYYLYGIYCYRLHNRSIKVLQIPVSSGSSGIGSTLGLFRELLKQNESDNFDILNEDFCFFIYAPNWQTLMVNIY